MKKNRLEPLFKFTEANDIQRVKFDMKPIATSVEFQGKSLPRSPYDRIHGLVYFGRMLDKIRLHDAGKLSADYVPNVGIKLDGICCRFLGIDYPTLVTIVTAGASDEGTWEWCLQNGKEHSDEEIMIWNTFMLKYGWRDDASEILQRRLKESGFENRADIQTIFDYIDLDEGRDGKGN